MACLCTDLLVSAISDPRIPPAVEQSNLENRETISGAWYFVWREERETGVQSIASLSKVLYEVENDASTAAATILWQTNALRVSNLAPNHPNWREETEIRPRRTIKDSFSICTSLSESLDEEGVRLAHTEVCCVSGAVPKKPVALVFADMPKLESEEGDRFLAKH